MSLNDMACKCSMEIFLSTFYFVTNSPITGFDGALCSQTDSLNKSLKPSFPNSNTISTKQLCGKSPICSRQFRSFGQHRQKVLLMVILYPCILLQT